MEAGGAGPELSFASVCALLEDRGYRRDQIRHLTPAYVNRVLCHPRDEKGGLALPDAQQAGESWADRMRRRLVRQGCPEHMVETRLAELANFSWRRRDA